MFSAYLFSHKRNAEVKNMGNDKAAIYIRVSTEEQRNEGCSLEAQEEELREYAASKGYTVFDVYCDGGYSGKDFNRPAIQHLFRDMVQDKFEAILVWRLDRLSRSNKDILTLIDNELEPRDMKLLVKTCDIDSSSTNGKMFISLQGTWAEYERKVTIDRVKSGMKQKAKNGEFNGGILFGYDVMDKRLVINELEAQVVKQIFELRAQGIGYKAIANTINSSGCKTKKGNNFGIDAIRRIVHNKEYVGINTWGKKEDWNIKRRKGKVEEMPEREGRHKEIISLELWEKVQAINNMHKQTFMPIKSYSGNFFLSGVIKCPQCGAGMVMHKIKMRSKNDYHRYYMCQSYHQKGKVGCSSNLVRADWIEQEVLYVLSESISNMNVVDDVLKKLEEDSLQDKRPLELQLNELKLQAAKQTKKLDSLDKKYLLDELDANTFKRLSSKLQQEIDETNEMMVKVERELGKLNNGTQINTKMVIELLKDFDRLFEVADEQEKKVLIRSVIKEIKVSKDRKKLERVSLWIGEDICLPANNERRAVSQVKASFYRVWGEIVSQSHTVVLKKAPY
ncbi:recombinase family protein [Brevibacillus fortis]|uniref:recombinase family protein n=1 Tax=Brevibacillus fortis TaxID=2126352 RepID=UPI0038FD3C65